MPERHPPHPTPGVSLLKERLVAIQDVPDRLPPRRGKKLHISTVYRWVQKGCRGRVLESALLGGIRYTSLEAIERFMGRTPASQLEQRRAEVLRVELARRGLA